MIENISYMHGVELQIIGSVSNSSIPGYRNEESESLNKILDTIVKFSKNRRRK